MVNRFFPSMVLVAVLGLVVIVRRRALRNAYRQDGFRR